MIKNVIAKDKNFKCFNSFVDLLRYIIDSAKNINPTANIINCGDILSYCKQKAYHLPFISVEDNTTLSEKLGISTDVLPPLLKPTNYEFAPFYISLKNEFKAFLTNWIKDSFTDLRETTLYGSDSKIEKIGAFLANISEIVTQTNANEFSSLLSIKKEWDQWLIDRPVIAAERNRATQTMLAELSTENDRLWNNTINTLTNSENLIKSIQEINTGQFKPDNNKPSSDLLNQRYSDIVSLQNKVNGLVNKYDRIQNCLAGELEIISNTTNSYGMYKAISYFIYSNNSEDMVKKTFSKLHALYINNLSSPEQFNKSFANNDIKDLYNKAVTPMMVNPYPVYNFIRKFLDNIALSIEGLDLSDSNVRTQVSSGLYRAHLTSATSNYSTPFKLCMWILHMRLNTPRIGDKAKILGDLLSNFQNSSSFYINENGETRSFDDSTTLQTEDLSANHIIFTKKDIMNLQFLYLSFKNDNNNPIWQGLDSIIKEHVKSSHAKSISIFNKYWQNI